MEVSFAPSKSEAILQLIGRLAEAGRKRLTELEVNEAGLAKKSIDVGTRSFVAAACVRSRLKRQAGRAAGAYYKSLSTISGVAGPPAADSGRASKSEVCRHTAMLPVEWELVAQRLLLAGWVTVVLLCVSRL